MEATWINPHSHTADFNIILPPRPKCSKSYNPLELSNTISNFTFHIPSHARDIVQVSHACSMIQI